MDVIGCAEYLSLYNVYDQLRYISCGFMCTTD